MPTDQTRALWPELAGLHDWLLELTADPWAVTFTGTAEAGGLEAGLRHREIMAAPIAP